MTQSNSDLHARLVLHRSRVDRRAGLLGKGLVSIDMRDPTRVVARMSREPGSKIETPPPAQELNARSVT